MIEDYMHKWFVITTQVDGTLASLLPIHFFILSYVSQSGPKSLELSSMRGDKKRVVAK